MNPDRDNIYITTLVCQGLLDLHQAELPWRQSQQLRDSLLAQTLDFLLDRFDGRGWSTPGRFGSDEFNDGLTLQVFATLLVAENAGLVKLPGAIVDQIPRHLAECGMRSLDHNNTVTLFWTAIRSHDGKAAPQRHLTSLWYPWAIKCSSLWYWRCKTGEAARDEVIRMRRVLGHLIINLGSAEVEKVRQGGMPFAIAETLIGLSAVDCYPWCKAK